VTTIVIGEETDQKYLLSYAVQALAVEGSTLSWWRVKNAQNALPYHDLRGLEGILTLPDGLSFYLYGIEGEDISIPIYLERLQVELGKNTRWWDCRERDWVDYEPEPISANEIRDHEGCYLSFNPNFKHGNLEWTFFPEQPVLDYFRKNPRSSEYSGPEGTWIKTLELSNKFETYWSYKFPWQHGKKRLFPIIGFSPGFREQNKRCSF
jgi:hypothetical protein